MDLLAAAHRPALLRESRVIGPQDPALVSGFHRSAAARTADALWMHRGPARIVLEFVAERSRVLELEARAFGWLGAPPLRVEVRLDGRPLGELTFRDDRWSIATLPIPGELSVSGRHLLELYPERAVAPREVLPDARDHRPLSIRFRRLRILPLATVSGDPEWAGGELSLPCGGEASWPLWIPEGAWLTSGLEAEGLPRETARFSIHGQGGETWLLDGPIARPLPEGPARLVLRCPAGSAGTLRVRRLTLDRPPAEKPPFDPAPAARRVAIVVGTLADGFPLAPCTTDRERALKCLLSGQEAAAFGSDAPPAVDFVGRKAGEVADFLAAASPPAIAALTAPDESAEVLAAAFRQRVPDAVTLLTSLPQGRDDLRVLARIADGAGAPPANASHLDLVPTAFALAGRRPPPRLSGFSLTPARRASQPARVRPAALLWDSDRSIALAADRALRVPLDESPDRGRPPDRDVLDAYLARLLDERRRALAWLAPLTVRPRRRR